MAKQELLVEVKKLISIGKEKGFLTYDELNSTLPAEVVSSEQFGSIMTMFGEMDIEIVDAPEGGDRQQKSRSTAEPEEAGAKRKEAITRALLGAAEVPLETARACARVAELAQIVAAKGNTNAVSDAGVAALLADAGCRGAVYNVRINISALDDRSLGAGLVEEAKQLLSQTRSRVDEVLALVERAIG